jgi:hypothetical protein
MGGKGGGGQQYYQEPLDKSGNATLEEAQQTLAKKAPLDMSGYQSNINVKKAASDATAKPAEDTSKPDSTTTPAEGVSGTETTKDSTGNIVAKSVLTPPGYWADYKQPGADPNAQV